MSQSRRRIQKNGRERGNPGNGIGSHNEISPLARGTQTKNKLERRNQDDRRHKQRGWSCDSE